jgi:hypothetical protein
MMAHSAEGQIPLTNWFKLIHDLDVDKDCVDGDSNDVLEF